MRRVYGSFSTYCQFDSEKELDQFLEQSEGFKDYSISKTGVWINDNDIELAIKYGGIIIV